ncbi:MAG: SLC13 family permease [Rhodospirillaceae bacterium]
MLSSKNFVSVLLAFAVGAITLILSSHTGMSIHGQRLLAVFTTIVVIWSTGCMNLPASCLLLLVLMSLAITNFAGETGGLKMSKAFQAGLKGFSGSVPITVVAGTAFAAVIRSSGLAERIVYLIMKLASGRAGQASAKRMLAAFFLADLPASIMIPSAMGRCALYMSIAEGLEKPFRFCRMDEGKPYNPFQKAIWIAVALIPIIMGSAFLTGAEATIMVGGMIEQGTRVPQFWANTFAILYAPALAVMFLSWFFLAQLYPSSVEKVDASFINEQLQRLGTLTYKEKYCLASLVVMIGLFLTDAIHHIPVPLILVAMCVVLFLPGIGAGDWKTDGKKITWDGYLIIGVALSFSGLLGQYKVMNFFAEKIALLDIHNYAVALAIMIGITLVIRLGIASITSAAALLVPISIAVGQGAGLTPFETVGLAWVTYTFCRISFFLPHQGAQLIMTFGLNYYEKRDLTRSAAYITAGAVAAYGLWSYLCISPILSVIS